MKKSLIEAIKKLLNKLGAEEIEGNNLVEIIDKSADSLEGSNNNSSSSSSYNHIVKFTEITEIPDYVTSFLTDQGISIEGAYKCNLTEEQILRGIYSGEIFYIDDQIFDLNAIGNDIEIIEEIDLQPNRIYLANKNNTTTLDLFTLHNGEIWYFLILQTEVPPPK